MTSGLAIAQPWSSRKRLAVGLAALLAALGFVAAGLSTPFVFESASLRYLFGFDKTVLRTGQLLGMAAGLALVLQLLLAARVAWLDRLLGLPALMRLHRVNGIVLTVLALAHPLLVFPLADVDLLFTAIEYWPEAVGVILLAGVAGMTAVALARRRCGPAYHRWRVLHQLGGALILAAFFVHLLFSSDSFETGVPRTAGAIAAVGCLGVWLAQRTRPWRQRTQRLFAVTRNEPAGRSASRLTLTPVGAARIAFLPGQFAVLRVRSAGISGEPHPFTIAAAPDAGHDLRFIIRHCGDWTARVPRIAAGERVTLEGPYGVFSHLLQPADRPLVLIAGGIGITPFFSMLGDMHRRNDTRGVTLIWSRRSAADTVLPGGWERMCRELPGLTVHHFFTAEAGGRRLAAPDLERLLIDIRRDAAVFVCGPPPMTRSVRAALMRIGYARRSIHSEGFGF